MVSTHKNFFMPYISFCLSKILYHILKNIAMKYALIFDKIILIFDYYVSCAKTDFVVYLTKHFDKGYMKHEKI